MPAPDPNRSPDPAGGEVDLPSPEAVPEAARRIAGRVHRTPVATSRTLDRMTGARLYFKCENLQRAGAFKARGAMNAVLSLDEAAAWRGVATHSSGNHGAALALAAAERGVPCRVVMPEGAPAVKRAAVAGYGAEIVPCAPTLEAREAAAARLIAETGATLVHPYDDPRVIAGQGTAALELLDEVPGLELLAVPVGGGGLAGGSALAAAALAPGVRVLGVEPAAADDAARSLAAGRRLAAPGSPRTVADGLRAGLSERTFRLLRQRRVRVVTVGEEAILDALRLVWERMKLVIEPSAAVPVAALLAGAAGDAHRVGVVLSGGNVDLDPPPWLQAADTTPGAAGG